MIVLNAGKISVVFDMHGVLASSKKIAELYLDNLIKIYEENGIHAREAINIYENNLRPIVMELRAIQSRDSAFIKDVKRVLNKWLILLTKNLPEKSRVEYHEELAFFSYEVASHKNTLFPEVKQVLQSLSKQGYILHIASTAGKNHLEGILEAGSIKRHFGNRVYGYETIKCFKNNIEYYNRLLEKVNHKRTKNVVLVGNSDDEAIVSKQAGIIPILINRERQLSEKAKKVSHAVLDDLSSLPSILRELHD
ncbi:MAG: HAD family hydrolase [Candidatus Hodarchaeales archaeon]